MGAISFAAADAGCAELCSLAPLDLSVSDAARTLVADSKYARVTITKYFIYISSKDRLLTGLNRDHEEKHCSQRLVPVFGHRKTRALAGKGRGKRLRRATLPVLTARYRSAGLRSVDWTPVRLPSSARFWRDRRSAFLLLAMMSF